MTEKTLNIAKDVAKQLLQAQKEPNILFSLKTIADSFDYLIKPMDC